MTVSGIELDVAAGIRVRIHGDGAAIRHFRAEYGPGLVVARKGVPDLEVAFVRRLPMGGIAFDGAHKTVSWSVRVYPVVDGPLRVAIATTGVPRSFVLSLVQGYYVETLLGVRAAERGVTLLPGAAISTNEGAMLIVGRSGTGKSTLSASALGEGRAIIGDDQVFVAPDGSVFALPRRLRFYPDLVATAPQTYARLASRDRAALRFWRSIRTLTRGFVAPPVRVPVQALGNYRAGPTRIASIAMIERTPEVADLAVEATDPDAAIDLVMPVIDDQRARLLVTEDTSWLERVSAARRRDVEILRAALTGPTITRYRVPFDWSAPRAMASLRNELGLARV